MKKKIVDTPLFRLTRSRVSSFRFATIHLSYPYNI